MVNREHAYHMEEEANLLVADLSNSEAHIEPIDQQILHKFYGGLGLNTWLLYRHTNPSTDPSGPDNIILMSPGLLTGTNAPTSTRVEVTTKSPLTSLIGTGNVGGYWGPKLKKAGISTIMVKGSSTQPITLIINDGKVDFKSAQALWGLDTYAATDKLVAELGPAYSVMAIGPAGEKLVKFAAPVFDKQHIPGRCHAGAVMGAKKLKAVAVKGTANLKPHNAKAYEDAVSYCESRIRSYPGWKAREKAGSMGTIGPNKLGVNYEDVVLPYVKRGVRGAYCPCTMEPLYGCNLQTNIGEGSYQGTDVTCAGLTLYSGLADWYQVSLPAAYHLRELCQRYGMDIFGPYSYAITLYENGIITSDDVDVKLANGNEEALMRLLDLVAHRRGFGDLLAEGSSKTGETLGGEARRYVQTVKGLELIRGDPQMRLVGNLYTTLSILTNPRGGDDLKGTHAVSNYPGVPLWAQKLGISRDDYTKWLVNWLDMPEDFKVKLFGDPPNISKPDPVHMTIWYNNLTSAYNSLGLCMFASSAADALGPTSMAMLHSAATGCATTLEDIMLTGERVFNLMRLYDIRKGVKKVDDLWPDSISKEASGEVSTFAVDSEACLERYYRLRGWDLETGRPEAQTLDRLGISV